MKTPDEIHAAVLAGLTHLEDLDGRLGAARWVWSGGSDAPSLWDTDGDVVLDCDGGTVLVDEFARAAIAAFRNGAAAQLAGRRAILQRHRPVLGGTPGAGWHPGCARCGRNKRWPCPDYAAAAADLMPAA